MLNKLEENAKTNPHHEHTLLMKVKTQREKIEMVRNSDEFKNLINSVDTLSIEIEAQLQRQSVECSRIFGYSNQLIRFPSFKSI